MKNRELQCLCLWPEFQKLNFIAQGLFIRIFACADETLRFFGDTAYIRSVLYAGTPSLRLADIDRELQNLEASGFIRRNDRHDAIEITGYAAQICRMESAIADLPEETPLTGVACAPASAVKDIQFNASHYNCACARYPETVDEVITIAGRPEVGCSISRDEAENYLNARMSVDWYDKFQRKILPSQVGRDIKRWVGYAAARPKQNSSRNILTEDIDVTGQRGSH